MRDLLLTLLIPGGMILGLLSAPAAIYVLTWIEFQRPQDFSWGMWNTMPVYMMALAVAIISCVIHRQFRLRMPGMLVMYLMLLAWMAGSAALAFDPEHAWAAYRALVVPMWVMPILLFASIDRLDMLKWVIVIGVGSIGLNAFKTGFMKTLGGGGHLTDQISGFVGDNNGFGLVVCVALALLLGLRSLLPQRRWARPAFYAALVFIFLCIVYTKSRGATLTLAMILVVASLLSGKPVRNLLLVALLALGAYWAVPPEYFDRLDTLREVSADESAMGRVENWRLAWDQALRHPVFGVGPENHIAYNNSQQVGVQVRVAHSIYFQVLGELGFPGMFLYLGLLFGSILCYMRTWLMFRKVVERHPDLLWVREFAFWGMCAMIGYAFGSGLLNTLYLTFPWFVMFMASLLRSVGTEELRKRGELPRGQARGARSDERRDSFAHLPRGGNPGRALRRAAPSRK